MSDGSDDRPVSFRVSGTSELVHVCCPARCVFARAAFSPRAVSREPVASLGPSSPRPVMTRPSGSHAQYCDSQELFLSKKSKKSRPQTVRPLGHASGVTGFCRGRSARKKETQTSGVRCEPWGRVVAAVRGKRLHESFVIGNLRRGKVLVIVVVALEGLFLSTGCCLAGTRAGVAV